MNQKAPIDRLVSETEPAGEPAGEPPEERVHLHMPVDIRSAALAVLAVLAALFTLSWAKAVFIPLLLGLMASYALTPVVDRFERWRVPRVLAAALLLSAIVGGLGATAYYLSDDAAGLVESLPDVAQKLRQTVQRDRRALGEIARPDRQGPAGRERA